MNLKEALLSFDGVIDNEYLDQYIELVNSTFSFSDTDYTEKHHVIPAACYRELKEVCMPETQYRREIVDADTRNYYVTLLFKDHCKAHWLLFNCTSGYLRGSNATAFINMTGKLDKLMSGLSDSEYGQLQHQRNFVKENSDFYWSRSEDAWLISNYPTKTVDECMEYLNRSKSSINCRVIKLGITSNPYWSKADTDWLIENYCNTADDDLVAHLDRSISSIRHKARSLGLPTKYRSAPKFFSVEEDQWLISHYGVDFSLEACATYLQRTVGVITNRARTLGILGKAAQRKNRISMERKNFCKAWLLKNYAKYTNTEAARILDISYNTLLTYAKELQLPTKAVGKQSSCRTNQSIFSCRASERNLDNFRIKKNIN